MHFILDGGSQRPLYQQLAAQLKQGIDLGTFKEGERLPAQLELSRETGLSKGTVQAAYAQLADERYIYKVKGSGAYVKNKRGPLDATTPTGLIDEILEKTDAFHSLSNTQLLLIARQEIEREFGKEEPVYAALADCNYETLHNMMEQLEQIKMLSVIPYLVDELLSDEASIDPRCVMMLVPQSHYMQLVRYADRMRLPMEQFPFSESRATAAALTVIPDSQSICAIYRSEQFIKNVRYSLALLQKRNELICGNENNIGEVVESCALRGFPFIVPADYLQYSNAKTLQTIERVQRRGGQVIPFRYEINKTFLMRLEEKIKRRGG